jgi:hypothetical protein
MRIDEVVRVQNPMGGDYKSQLDRDRAAAAVRAQRQANREMPNRGAVSGAKSGTDPQGGMFTPGAVTTKSYNNALTKQFARPAGQGKGVDIMGNPLKQPAQRKIEPAQQEPQQPTTAPTTPDWVGQNTNIPAVQRKAQAQQTQQINTARADLALLNKATASLQGGPALTPQELEKVNAYRVDKGQPPIPAQLTTQPAAQTTATAGTSAHANAPTNTQATQTTGQVQGVKQKIDPALVKEFDGIVDVTPKLKPQIKDAKGRTWTKLPGGWTMDGTKREIDRKDSTYIAFDDAWRKANGFPTSAQGTSMGSTANNQPQQQAPQTTDRPNPYMTPQANTPTELDNPYMTPQANTPSEPEQQTQTMPNEPVKIGGQKLNPNDPTDAKMLQMIQKQLPQMPTPQVAAVKQVADKTLATRRRNKPKKRF